MVSWLIRRHHTLRADEDSRVVTTSTRTRYGRCCGNREGVLRYSDLQLEEMVVMTEI